MNIRDGGGLTHLYEILNCATENSILFDKIIIWANDTCLNQLPNKSWLIKINPLPFKNSYWRSILWQIFLLGSSARKMNCSLLFIAGGSAMTSFKPKVTICHNMLPFSSSAIQMYPNWRRKIKIKMLHDIQLNTFNRVDGMIFLSKWAEEKIIPLLANKKIKSAVIPHGISSNFSFPNRQHRNISDCDELSPFSIIYVSRIEPYKNHLSVIDAINNLCDKTGWYIKLQFIGLASDVNHSELVKSKISEIKSKFLKIECLGSIPYGELGNYYHNADIGVFASSCENMPIILLEKMAAGLPLICNDQPPMRDYLQDAGMYVKFSNISSATELLHELIIDVKQREIFSKAGVEIVKNYSWFNTSLLTFKTLYEMSKT